MDTLKACLGGTGSYTKAVAQIRPADGVGPTFSITDTSVGDGCRSTGNLSIPEDERYILTLTVSGSRLSPARTGSVSFYT
ncbi:hypothetical protein [Kribbella sp. VKM Ac-2569]|uniref:hypothetical protein n=1 Tax=Kribbella sp. VKM Ac-2569 TaxID=2512220 RepID=UPI00102AFFB0|nr:hypothetical protein [Kribbella sp. VKM Ac-2569]